MIKQQFDTLNTVEGKVFPYDYWHDWYQEYYREGLRRYLVESGSNFELLSDAKFPSFLRLLRSVRHSNTLQRILDSRSFSIEKYIDWLAWHSGAKSRPSAPLVGEYTFRLADGQNAKVCIDSHDSGEISSPELLATSDIYLKTNYWMGTEYDERVVPFFNCNPNVLPYLKRLKTMRSYSAQYDICFIVRVWGGKHEAEGSSEHCLRLLEAVAKAPGNNFLLAYLVSGDVAGQGRRLRNSGVPTTTSPISPEQLWEITAKSRLNIIRLGMHQCIPWRVSDLFALGACPILDQAPKTIWPIPIVQGQHFHSLNIETSHDRPVGAASNYDGIPELLRRMLDKKDRNQEIRKQTASYFDAHLELSQVGRHICNIVLSKLGWSPDPAI